MTIESTPTEVEVTSLEQTELEGDTVNRIANKIEEVLLGEDLQAAVAAMIALSIMNIRRGEYTGDDLGRAIFEVSQFISMLPVDAPAPTPMILES